MSQARGVQGQLLRMEIAESAYGTDPSSAYCVKLPFNSCGLEATRNLIEPATITGRRDAVQPGQGRVDARGPAVVPLEQVGVGFWLKALLGSVVTTSTGGNLFSHAFKVSSKLDSFVYEKGMTDVGAYEKFIGVKVAGMALNVGGDEELTLSFDLVGKKATPSGSSMSASTTTLSLTRFNQHHAILKEGGAALDGKVRTLSLNVANNLDESIYTVSSGGSAERGDLPEGLCQVTGEMEIMFENWSYYLRAVSGTERSLTLTFQDNSVYLEFDIDELIFERHSPPIETPEGLWLTLPYRAFYDNGSNASILQATLVNSWSAYSGHA